MPRSGRAYGRPWTEPFAAIDATSGLSALAITGSVRRAAPILLAPLALALALAAGSCGSGGDDSEETTTSAPRDGAAAHRAPAREHDGGEPGDRARSHDHSARGGGGRGSVRAAVRAAVAESDIAPLEGEQRASAKVVRAYVDALDARQGRRACSLFAPGALSAVDLPRDRGDCGESLAASIGYRDPRGFPVFSGSRAWPGSRRSSSTARAPASRRRR